MPWFQIEPDWKGAGKRRVKVTLEAATWMEALQAGAEKLRPGTPLRDVQVEFLSGGVTVVRDGTDGFALRLTEVDGPPKLEGLEEPSTIRESPALVERPKLQPGKRYVTYTGPREAMKRPEPAPAPAPAPAPKSTSRDGSARNGLIAAARSGARMPQGSERSSEAPRRRASASTELAPTALHPAAAQRVFAPTFRLAPELLARVKKCCWMGVNRRMFEGLVEIALELVPSESGASFRCEPRTGELELVAAWGPRAQRLLASGLVLGRGEGVVGAAAAQRVLVLVADAANDPRFLADVARAVEYPVHNAIAAPIATRSAVLGVVELLNRKGGGSFTDADAMKLSQFVRAASGFLEGRA